MALAGLASGGAGCLVPRPQPPPQPAAAASPPPLPRPPRSARTWWPWLIAGLAVLALIGTVAWGLLGSSLFGARSVQVVARPNDEATLISLAAQLESARPWAQQRPPAYS